MTDDSFRSDTELLERYAAEGVQAKRDPAVAAFVAANPGLVARLDRVLAAQRARIMPDAGDALPDAVRAHVAQTRGYTGGVYVAPSESGERAPARRLGDGLGRFERSPVRSWVGYAAAAMVVAIGSVVALRGWRTTEPRLLSTRSYATHVGQRLSVMLPDGSRMMLAPQTTVRLAATSDGARTMTLEGEAYFDVVHSARTPFRVVAGNTTTDVLGTTFSVRHYATDPGVRVAVAAGKVSVVGRGPRHPSVLLTAGLVGDVTDSSAITNTPDDLGPYTGWVNEKLVFYDTPAPEVLAALTRWYGYEFRLADSTILRRHLTAGVSTRSSAEALSTLKLLLNVDMKFDGSVVTLVPTRTSGVRERRDATPVMTHHDSEVGL